MNKLFIKRTSPNTGIVYAFGQFFEEVPVTGPLKYQACKVYIEEHQENLTLYKVARILNRANAKRTLYKRFLAADNKEAMATFEDICRQEESGNILQLLTGDWKMIAEKDRNDLIKII